jgi:predicted acylesterase/phospholipase RssA
MHETALLAWGARVQTAEQHEPRTELVLLHGANATTATGTAAWIAPRNLKEHYHVRIGNKQDLLRLARRLTGHAHGLVLGGGGARGFAHVGVFRALEEAGLEMDIVAGTSMGAIVAGGIGMCMSAVEMRKMAQQLSSPSKLYDPTLPVVSLFSGAKTTHALQQIYGETMIEDLWRPMFCISTNVTRAKATIHRQGPLWEAVRASMSLPGIFPPVLYHGDLLVDGGVMNNLPIDIMREFVQGGCIVAVNVSPPEDLMKEYHYGPSISGGRALLSKLNRHDNISVPLIFECLTRIMVLHDVNRRESKQQLADIFISPQVQQYGLLEFAAYDPIIEIGYTTAKDVLEKEGEKELHFQ